MGVQPKLSKAEKAEYREKARLAMLPEDVEDISGGDDNDNDSYKGDGNTYYYDCNHGFGCGDYDSIASGLDIVSASSSALTEEAGQEMGYVGGKPEIYEHTKVVTDSDSGLDIAAATSSISSTEVAGQELGDVGGKPEVYKHNEAVGDCPQKFGLARIRFALFHWFLLVCKITTVFFVTHYSLGKTPVHVALGNLGGVFMAMPFMLFDLAFIPVYNQIMCQGDGCSHAVSLFLN